MTTHDSVDAAREQLGCADGAGFLAGASVAELVRLADAAATAREQLGAEMRAAQRVRRWAIAEAALRDGCTAVARRLGLTRQRVSQMMHEEESTR
jgi:hypothetical protein